MPQNLGLVFLQRQVQEGVDQGECQWRWEGAGSGPHRFPERAGTSWRGVLM